MWFDVQKAVASLVEGDMPSANLSLDPPNQAATFAAVATNSALPSAARQRVASVAIVAATPAAIRITERPDDAERLADLLATSGPTTYGAAAVALGWGATRAWQAEARLRASGRAAYDALGRARLTGQDHSAEGSGSTPAR